MLADAQTELSPPTVEFCAALIKVASRCNLNCDYCYVYQHADQTWKTQPRFISEESLRCFGWRLDEYVKQHSIREFCVTFHGGEPLLFGAPALIEASRIIRDLVTQDCALEFSLQSNGTLLTAEAADQLEEAGILVSLSLDGPQAVNDLHRLNHAGKSSFTDVVSAIEVLRNRPIFRGVIGVIDPTASPRDLFRFFSSLNIPRLDLLLPDATHLRPPPGRDSNSEIFVDWLAEAFRVWFKEFPSLPIRWFDAALASRLGVPSPTDAMGMGSVSLIVIDTDGSYTDHDVFKITTDGGSKLGRTLKDTSLEDISSHPGIRAHAHRLTLAGLPAECRSCPVVEACGGGSVMHRWHGTRGLDAPSVYCRELFHLLSTATTLLKQSLQPDTCRQANLTFPFWGTVLIDACTAWREETEMRADATSQNRNRDTSSAASILLRTAFGDQPPDTTQPNGQRVSTWLDNIRIQSSDPWLVRPFFNSIRVLPADSEAVRHAIKLFQEVEGLFAAVHPSLPEAFSTLISDIVIVESTVEADDQIFSFSDDSAPNVLYVASYVGGIPLEADDFGDSLFHEFLHHLLYHFERHSPLLHDSVFPHFPAPWRPGLRPAGGFFHGTFVFANLSIYWQAVERLASPSKTPKAATNASRFRDQAAFGIGSLQQFALLTDAGEQLLDSLACRLSLISTRLSAPGGLN